MSFFRSLDKGLYNVVSVICGVCVAAILIIINVQVICRFVFNFSLGGLSDMPPYLMIYTVWLGAIMAARNDDHISIQLLDLFVKNKKVIWAVDAILYFITAVSLIIFSKVAFDYTAHAFAYGSTDQGTGIPLGCFYMILPFASLLMGIYYFVNTGKKIQRIKKGE